MEKAKAIELLKDIITNKVSIHGGNEEAIRMAIAALEKAPTALDHIHNVVAEREYQRGYKQAKEEYDHKLTEIKSRIKDHYYNKGYKQGKADANYPEFPDSWIPVSEGLPKKDDKYQVTRHDDVTDTEFIDILWYEKNTWWNRYSTGNYAVTAWMPLPEPYKEGEQHETD